MAPYRYKYVCKKCGAVHWFNSEKCKRCEHTDLTKIDLEAARAHNEEKGEGG